MTPDQISHLASLLDRFASLTSAKYEKGAEEHTGNVWDASLLTLIDNAIEESIDQFVYLMTIRDKVVTVESTNEARAPIAYYCDKCGKVLSSLKQLSDHPCPSK